MQQLLCAGIGLHIALHPHVRIGSPFVTPARAALAAVRCFTLAVAAGCCLLCAARAPAAAARASAPPPRAVVWWLRLRVSSRDSDTFVLQ